jgi:general secretion pathway protein G
MKDKVKRAGFTLVEFLVVVAMIMILTSFVGVRILHKPAKARVAAARAQIISLKSALSTYRIDNGFIPTEEQGLIALIVMPTNEPIPMHFPEGEGYLDSRAVPLDPWGNEYVYLSPGSEGERFEIICYGADGEPGGDDVDADISSSDM